MWALFVRPSHWRRGVGRLLCERSCAEARRRGLAGVELWELESNAGARRFFHALGFRPDGGKRVFLEHAGVALHELRYRRAYRRLDDAAGRAQPGQRPDEQDRTQERPRQGAVRIIDDAAEPAERARIAQQEHLAEQRRPTVC